MKAGKISEAAAKRSVIKIVNKQKKQMVSKAGVGVDAGIFLQEEMTGNPAAASAGLAGKESGLAALAVHRACNSLAAAGGNPTAVTVQLMLPETMEETEVKQTMQELLKACEAADVALVNGHTQVSPFVTERVVSVTAMGTVPGQMTLEETVYGSDLVMTKTAGLSGASLLAKNHREQLHERYTYSFIDKAVKEQELSVLTEAKAVQQFGIRHMHDVAEGGVFGAVWELCERLHAGVELYLKQIPICQETVEITEYFDINPYQMKGDGSLLFVAQDGASVVRALQEQGISAAVIGRMTEGNDRILINEDETRFLEPNRVDDYEKVRR